MGKCAFCGRETEIGSESHGACVDVFSSGKVWIKSMIGAFVSNERELHELKYAINLVSKLSYINNNGLHELVLLGYQQAVNQALEDHLLTVEEERCLETIEASFGLTSDELESIGASERLLQARIIRRVSEGKLVEFPTKGLRLPFNLHISETVVWIFSNVDYYEQQTRARFRLGHSELSANIASLYLKASEISADVESEDRLVCVDTGILAITTKHIYFAGSSKRSRIHYNNVVSFVPYKSGIGVVQEGQTIDTQIFVTGDGWFTHNLATSLARRA